jgi:hypothetical protein
MPYIVIPQVNPETQLDVTQRAKTFRLAPEKPEVLYLNSHEPTISEPAHSGTKPSTSTTTGGIINKNAGVVSLHMPGKDHNTENY